MGIFFSKKKQPSRVTEQDKAILVRNRLNPFFVLVNCQIIPLSLIVLISIVRIVNNYFICDVLQTENYVRYVVYKVQQKCTVPYIITSKHFCLQQVKQTRDKIKQYQRKIEQSLEKERLLAKELLKNGKKE